MHQGGEAKKESRHRLVRIDCTLLSAARVLELEVSIAHDIISSIPVEY